MRRSIASVSDFAEYFNENLIKNCQIPFKYGKIMAHQVSQVSQFMKTTKGRDKICSIIQYISAFYYACGKEFDSNPNHLRLQSIIIAGRVKVSMKNGRKIFKLLKFFDSVRGIEELLAKPKPFPTKMINLTCHFCNFFYYILDHILWGLNLEIFSVSEKSHKITKGWKDSFSLVKSVLKIVKARYSYQQIIKKENELKQEIQFMQSKKLQEESIQYQSCVSLLKSRRKRRMKQVTVYVILIRMIMLWKRLRMPFNKVISRVIYSFCGLIATSMQTWLELNAGSKLIKIQEYEDAQPEKPKFKIVEKKKEMLRTTSFAQGQLDVKRANSDLENLLDQRSDSD